MKAFTAALPLLALLAACDRNTAPADEVVQTAAEVVGACLLYTSTLPTILLV